MLQQHSLVKVVDNSGYGKVKVIRVYGKRKVRQAMIGNLVLVSTTKKKAANLPRKLLKALVVGTKAPFKRDIDGSYITFPENSVIIVEREKNFFEVLGSRVKYPVPLEVAKLLSKKSRSKIDRLI